MTDLYLNQLQKKITQILANINLNLSFLDLGNFNTFIEHKRLNNYLTSALESLFQLEDEWLKYLIQILLSLNKKKML